jgi:acyl-CoA dehydrogenase
MASETMNCSAPDTGNMEVLERVGTKAQKEKWLKPLLAGEIRSAYAMTEPNVASSDAKKRLDHAKLVGDEWVINGEKYYISGAGDPRCKIMIVMVKTNPDAPPSKQQSQILVPIDTPGVEILARCRCSATTTRRAATCTCASTIAGCRRKTCCSAKAAALKSRRSASDRAVFTTACVPSARRKGARHDGVARLTREAFRQEDRPSRRQLQIIAQARCEIEAMRLMVLKAAKAMDVLGNKEARIWVSMVKAMVPERTCKIIDQAIQMHGATGISQWSPLGEMYQDVRHLRFADGPDEVHWMVVGRHELSMP